MPHNDCIEPAAHLAARLVKSPQPGDGNETQNHMDRLRANVAGPSATMPTGYIDHCDSFPLEAQGSGSERGWDSGFAQDGDPYGIQSEYVVQSASPNAALPTQQAERDERITLD